MVLYCVLTDVMSLVSDNMIVLALQRQLLGLCDRENMRSKRSPHLQRQADMGKKEAKCEIVARVAAQSPWLGRVELTFAPAERRGR